MSNQYPAVSTRQSTPFDNLLTQSRDLVCTRLGQAIAGMFDKAGDTLAAAISETQDKEQREVYTEARDGIFKQRKSMEEQFRIQYLKEFEGRGNQMQKTAQSFSDLDLSTMQLDLVGDDDLKETLKVNDMANMLRRYCEEELAALDQRVGVLLGDANLEADNNPFCPQAICNAYKFASHGVSSKVAVRMILLKLFDDLVLDEIRSIYKAVNALLVQNSILPKIRFAVTRSQDGAKASSGAQGSGGEAPAVPAQGAPGGDQDFFALLKNALAGGANAAQAGGASGIPGIPGIPGFSGLGGGSAPANPGGTPTVVIQGAELMSLLSRVQQEQVRFVAPGDQGAVEVDIAGAANVLRELKATSVGAGMNQLDNMTLDIVAMLFDQLFDDPKIPIAVKGLIGRMQICFLKVAIADKDFFSKKTHPARRMLDTLGEISLRLSADFGATHPLFGRLETIIQELLDGYEDTLDVFDHARDTLQQLVEEEDKRVALETHATAERIKQTENMAVSKVNAQSEVRVRVLGRELPLPVRGFLVTDWVKVLLVVHVQRGPNSEIWKNTLSAMDQLIWSVRTDHTPEERIELGKVVPALRKRLAAGLKICGADDSIRERFFTALKALHDKILNSDAGGQPAALASSGAKAGAAKAKSARAGKAKAAPDDTTQPSLEKTQPLPDYVPETPAAGAAPEVESDLPSLTKTQPIDFPAAEPAAAESVSGPDPAAAPPVPDSLDFTDVMSIKNPFGEGRVEVKALDMAELSAAGSKSKAKDTEFINNLKIGAWVEFRDPDKDGGPDKLRPAKLSYVSPLKTRFLFVDRVRSIVSEYSRAELAIQFNLGKVSLIEEVSFFDRIMKGVVSKLH